MTTIASWNINSVRARLHLLEEWLQEDAPDILLLQETKVQDAEFPQELFERFHYNLALFGEKSYNGVAIASKGRIEDIERHSFTCGEEARYIEGSTLGIRVASVYVPNGQTIDSPAYAAKLSFLDALRTHLNPFLDSDEPFCVAGDFNVAPFDEDIAHPQEWVGHVLCSEKERDAVRALLYEGWTDAQPQTTPKNPFTWWDYRGRSLANDDGLRIDYALLSPRARDKKTDFAVLKKWRMQARSSDHAPILLTLN